MYEHSIFFPDEAFDAEREDDTNIKFVHNKFEDTLRQAAAEVRDSYNGEWNKDHELELARTIQRGLAAEQQLRTDSNDKHQELFETVNEGRQARHDLVIANLPFAAYLARASVGRRSLPAAGDVSTPAIPTDNSNYLGNLKEAGAYGRIANLATPRASYEDRLQIAMEAMWKASEKYTANHDRSAKFITYAAWHIHSALRRESSEQENGGWYVSDALRAKYTQQLDDARMYNTEIPSNYHLSATGSKQMGLHPEQMLEGRLSVPIDSIATYDDEVDMFGEPIPLGLDEVVASMHDDDYPAYVTQERDRSELLRKAIETLDARSASIVETRYGLTSEGGAPITLDQTGLRHNGISRERVRQIETKAIEQLRHPSVSKVLRDYRTGIAGDIFDGMLLPIADGTGNLKTKRVLGRAAMPTGDNAAIRPPRDSQLESWQVYPDEPFDLNEA